MTRDEMRKLAREGLRLTDRCDGFYDEDQPCDGMEGCEQCLRLAAEAAADAIYDRTPP